MAKIRIESYPQTPQSFTPQEPLDTRPISQGLVDFGQALQEQDDSKQKLLADNELLMRKQAKEEIDAEMTRQLQNNLIDSNMYPHERAARISLYDKSRADVWNNIRPDIKAERFDPLKKAGDIADIQPVMQTYLAKQKDEHMGALATNLSLIDNQLANDNNIDNARDSINNLGGDLQTLFGNGADAKRQDILDKVFTSHISKLSNVGEDFLLSGDLNSAKQVYEQMEANSQRIGTLGYDTKNLYENTAHALANKIATVEQSHGDSQTANANEMYSQTRTNLLSGNIQDGAPTYAKFNLYAAKDVGAGKENMISKQKELDSLIKLSASVNKIYTTEGYDAAIRSLDATISDKHSSTLDAYQTTDKANAELLRANLVSMSYTEPVKLSSKNLFEMKPSEMQVELTSRQNLNKNAIFSQQEIDEYNSAILNKQIPTADVLSLTASMMSGVANPQDINTRLDQLTNARQRTVSPDGTVKVVNKDKKDIDPIIMGTVRLAVNASIPEQARFQMVEHLRNSAEFTTMQVMATNPETLKPAQYNKNVKGVGGFSDNVEAELFRRYGNLSSVSTFFVENRNSKSTEITSSLLAGAFKGTISTDTNNNQLKQDKSNLIFNNMYGRSSVDYSDKDGDYTSSPFPLVFNDTIPDVFTAQEMMKKNNPELSSIISKLGKNKSAVFADPSPSVENLYVLRETSPPYREIADKDGKVLTVSTKAKH